jgi:hypothetical protein
MEQYCRRQFDWLVSWLLPGGCALTCGLWYERLMSDLLLIL